ncbi:MAG: hypothetical protein DIZ80_13115 [endosymbiont of Galathealinum brachiosum]|uniref:Uncharacterized protein n=1 Tax=endosymbiont of Galathealinum brachiosum TaxID=2200906 RepID=A0A370D7Z8_9GAMM|nr:MAG: hypothetical protein DIZ80_13115 [endosymbiont of Galathealinum brachiosum]
MNRVLKTALIGVLMSASTVSYAKSETENIINMCESAGDFAAFGWQQKEAGVSLSALMTQLVNSGLEVPNELRQYLHHTYSSSNLKSAKQASEEVYGICIATTGSVN